MITLWKVNVVHADGTKATYDVSPRTIVAFERHFKMGLAAAFAKDMKYEHTYWLAWEAERQAGVVVKPFDSWLEGVSGVDVDIERLPFGETP
jgi:hypothetical protein